MKKIQGRILTMPTTVRGSIGAQMVNIGEDGATFVPSVSTDGVISWTNDKDLPNPEPVNIMGAKGEKGDKGDKGDQGIQGVQGVKGDQGEQGIQGVQGVKGDKGDKGDDGAQGAQGEKGETGAAGQDGKDGTNGVDGVSVTKTEINNRGELVITLSDDTVSNLGVVVGAKGDKGDQGIQGVQGVKGDKGDTGATGANGKDGIDGKDGKDGENGRTPVLGVDYFTEADKAEMVSAVIASLPVYNGEVVSV